MIEKMKVVITAVRLLWQMASAYRKVDTMLTVTNQNGQKVSLWGTLAQMAIVGVASYGMAKAENPKTEWAGYRDAMLQNMAQVAIPTALSLVPTMKPKENDK